MILFLGGRRRAVEFVKTRELFFLFVNDTALIYLNLNEGNAPLHGYRRSSEQRLRLCPELDPYATLFDSFVHFYR